MGDRAAGSGGGLVERMLRGAGSLGLSVGLWAGWAVVASVAVADAPAASASPQGPAIDVGHGAVAAEHRLASRAGVQVLRAGGNAIDAAVAAALAAGVVNPSSSSLGGGGFLVLWKVSDGKARSIDFREVAPSGARRDMYVGKDGKADSQASKTGGLAVGVPGEPAGLAYALSHYGRLSTAAVAAPAIALARDGFTVAPYLAEQLVAQRDRIAADPALASVFLHADGTPYRAGETLRRPDLAATLQSFAAGGAEPFYRGTIAADIVAAVRARGGVLSAGDLAAYRPVERAPTVVDYRDVVVFGMAPPSSGGGVMGEALEVLEAYDVAAMGRGSVSFLHLLADTLKGVFADRAIVYGDPAFTKVPLTRLLSPAHAAAIRSHLRADAAVPSSEFGKQAAAADDAGTSHTSVIDADGNAAALTTSINTSFGAGLSVPGHDLLLNNTMDDFSAQPGVPNHFGLVGSEANAIAPGKRPLSSMSPTIVLKDGRVRLVVGGSGGPVILTATLQTLLGVVDFGQGVGEAVTAPRLHQQWLPETLSLEAAIPEADKQALVRLGHQVVPLAEKRSVSAVEVVGKAGQRHVRAISDPRKGGAAVGY